MPNVKNKPISLAAMKATIQEGERILDSNIPAIEFKENDIYGSHLILNLISNKEFSKAEINKIAKARGINIIEKEVKGKSEGNEMAD